MCSLKMFLLPNANASDTTQRLTKFWEIKTWKEEEMLRKKTIEKLICLNRCLHLVTQNPRKNARHLGFVFLAELASRSDDYIETWRHLPKEALVQMLRAARAPQDYISAVPPRLFDVRDATTQSRDLKHTKSPPRPYTLNHEVGGRSIGMRFSILKAVCMGTTYDQTWSVRESESLGSPSSHACLRAFVHGWTRWAGWPKLVRCDRGTHNRGVVGSTLTKNGVAIRPAGLEAPEQIRRVERRGAMLKKMMSKVIKDTHASSRESTDMSLSDCLNAANEMTRHGGFVPAQWVLSRLPRNPATIGDECLNVGALQAHADGPTTFRVQSRYRAKARGWIQPSWGHSLVLPRSTRRRTRTAMERRFVIDRFREGQKQPR